VKLWANEHPDLNTQPAFKFSIKAQYRDCLSRQVGEAIVILHSKDGLLNSKSEYLNNCLTRKDWEMTGRGKKEKDWKMKLKSKCQN
jgi:hypothetical protein